MPPFAYRNQPLKALYILYSTLYFFIALPAWVVAAAIPAWRPRRRWPMSRALILRIMQFASKICHAIDLLDVEPCPDPVKQALNADKLGFVWIEPVPADMVKGEVAAAASINHVQPARISGYWYGSQSATGAHGQRAGLDEKVVYHMHAGGFVTCTAAPTGMNTPVINGLLEHLSGIVNRAFSLEYRLSASAPREPVNPFPAALLDTLAGYRYLVEDLRFAPSNIIISGDSVGAGLAISLMRYLIAEVILPVPGAALFLSPSVDWGYTHDSQSPHSSVQRNRRCDYVWGIYEAGYSKRSIVGSLPASYILGPWISPASLHIECPNGLLAGLPRTLIAVGGAEDTVDSYHTFRDRLQNDIGEENVTFLEFPDAVHDFCIFTWHEPERSQCYKAIRLWVERIYYAEPLI